MISYPLEYYYSASQLIGAVVNILMAVFLLFSCRGDEMRRVPAYRRSCMLTAGSLLVFAVGFLLHWGLGLRAISPVLSAAVSLAYFHLGGMLLSMSHTSLASSAYLSPRTVGRDVCWFSLALVCYIVGSILGNLWCLLAGCILTVVHLSFLAVTFYRTFRRSYALLGTLAEFRHIDHGIDRRIRWLYFSCHIIIFFGIGGSLLTAGGFDNAISPSSMIRGIIMMGMAIFAFAYFFFTLSGFGVIAQQALSDLHEAERFAATPEGKECLEAFIAERERRSPWARYAFFTGLYRQW